jgi:hypothetical protein
VKHQVLQENDSDVIAEDVGIADDDLVVNRSTSYDVDDDK